MPKATSVCSSQCGQKSQKVQFGKSNSSLPQNLNGVTVD